MPAQRIPNTARRTESSPLPVPTTVATPSSSGLVNLLVGTDSVRGDSRTVHTGRAGGTKAASPLSYLPVPFPTAPARATSAPATLVVKPPRHNFAGYCIMCGQCGCQSQHCIALYAETAWAVCATCHGEGYLDGHHRCGCLFGVNQVDDDWPGAVA
jgi:hypothetical protein